MGRRLGSRTVRSEEDRIYNYRQMVDERGPDDCWPWLGASNRAGYGHFFDGLKFRSAAAYGHEALIGPIPDGLELNHSCASKDCQNPAHWFLDTHAANMEEMFERTGRRRSSR